MYKERLAKYKEIEELRHSKLLVYITGDRPGMETQIHQEVVDYFTNHLDTFGLPNKITLFLYSRGGNTLAGWGIVNLIRQFCKEFEVIVPSKALSTATIICLGANRIIMTKQATLGPIDPSINTPLNPQIPGGGVQAKFPVSVEAMKGFLELAKNESKIRNLNEVFLKLSDHVHPLVLGEAYRARTQIKFLARRLLSQQIKDRKKINKIIDFLCSESGSHDYTINRREARDQIGLQVEKPDDNFYAIIKNIFDDIRLELQLNNPYNPFSLLGTNQQLNYSLPRCLIESVSGGDDRFLSEGVIRKTQVPVAPNMNVFRDGFEDQRTFEGWRHGTE